MLPSPERFRYYSNQVPLMAGAFQKQNWKQEAWLEVQEQRLDSVPFQSQASGSQHSPDQVKTGLRSESSWPREFGAREPSPAEDRSDTAARQLFKPPHSLWVSVPSWKRALAGSFFSSHARHSVGLLNFKTQRLADQENNLVVFLG